MNLKLLIFSFGFFFLEVNCTPLNNRPIIGILCEEFSVDSAMHGKSFITTPYVKFVESSGAQAVPILVLLPGGGDLLQSAGYGKAGRIIFDLAVKMNNQGDYFPIWGTCLGFELLNLAASGKMWMKRCSADDVALNIDFVNGSERSRMFSRLPSQLKGKMQRQNLTIHLHHWCITPQNYSLSGLDQYFKVLALNTDFENTTFVSIIEAIKYPFYGVTFHPEKPVYDWSPYHVPIPHTQTAVKASHYFGNFFIREARKSFHKFPSKSEEDKALIYNYNPQRGETETDLSNQMYIFQ